MCADKVNFRAYCAAFEAMGKIPETEQSYASRICDELYQLHNDEIGDSISPPDDDVTIHRDRFGDGTISVPVYKNLFGERMIAGWRCLSFHHRFSPGGPGEITPSLGSKNRDDAESDHLREALSYFIEGAFGGEIPQSSNAKMTHHDLVGRPGERAYFRDELDTTLVAGLRELFSLCLREGAASCQKAKPAAEIGRRWSDILASREKRGDGRKDVSPPSASHELRTAARRLYAEVLKMSPAFQREPAASEIADAVVRLANESGSAWEAASTMTHAVNKREAQKVIIGVESLLVRLPEPLREAIQSERLPGAAEKACGMFALQKDKKTCEDAAKNVCAGNEADLFSVSLESGGSTGVFCPLPLKASRLSWGNVGSLEDFKAKKKPFVVVAGAASDVWRNYQRLATMYSNYNIYLASDWLEPRFRTPGSAGLFLKYLDVPLASTDIKLPAMYLFDGTSFRDITSTFRSAPPSPGAPALDAASLASAKFRDAERLKQTAPKPAEKGAEEGCQYNPFTGNVHCED